MAVGSTKGHQLHMTCRAESRPTGPQRCCHVTWGTGGGWEVGYALLTVHRGERRIKTLSDRQKDIYILPLILLYYTTLLMLSVNRLSNAAAALRQSTGHIPMLTITPPISGKDILKTICPSQKRETNEYVWRTSQSIQHNGLQALLHITVIWKASLLTEG